MWIKRLKLTPFAGVEDLDLTFEKGVILLTGDNGQGKSTIPKAINLILFDKSDQPLAKYVPWGGTYFRIECWFSHRGHEYDVMMKYDGSTERTLSINEEAPYSGAAEVVRQLADILDPKLDLPACYAPQGEPSIVSTTPSERRDLVLKTFDVSTIAEVRELEEEDSNLLDQRVHLQSELALLQKQTFDLHLIPESSLSPQEVKDLDARLELLQQKATELTANLTKLVDERARYLEMQSALDQASIELHKVENLLTDKLSILTELKSIDIKTSSSFSSINSQLLEEKKAETALCEELHTLENSLAEVPSLRLPVYDDSPLVQAKTNLEKHTYQLDSLRK